MNKEFMAVLRANALRHGIQEFDQAADYIVHLESLCREVVEAARPYGNWKHDLVPTALTDKLRKEVG